MSTPTPSIPGVDRDALIAAIHRDTVVGSHLSGSIADVVLAYIAAHHECAQPLVNPAIENGWLVERVDKHTCGGSSNEWPYAHEPSCGLIPVLNLSSLEGWQECDRDHTDEWDEVDDWSGLPNGKRVRREWVVGAYDKFRHFVRRDDLPADLPDDPRTLIARELGSAKADTFLGLLDEHGWTVTRKGER